MHGNGVLQYPNSSPKSDGFPPTKSDEAFSSAKYDGEFRFGVFHGSGKFYYSKGLIIIIIIIIIKIIINQNSNPFGCKLISFNASYASWTLIMIIIILIIINRIIILTVRVNNNNNTIRYYWIIIIIII